MIRPHLIRKVIKSNKKLAKDVDLRDRKPSYKLIYHRDNPKAMDSSKSENSVLPLHPSGSPVGENRENALAKKLTPTYESTTFSGLSLIS